MDDSVGIGNPGFRGNFLHPLAPGGGRSSAKDD